MNRNVPIDISIGAGHFQVGGEAIHVIAGPCSIESEAQYMESGVGVRQAGARLYRGGIFKMRSSPESFQGLGKQAFEFILKRKSEIGLPLVSEVTDPRQIPMMGEVVDMFQVGARNMYNYELLKELALAGKPVLLKRAFSATIDEWIKSAAYLSTGRTPVILCERGIRSFDSKTRNALDLNAVAFLKAETPFKVFVDPSHGTGRRDLVPPMARAAVAAGADGLLLEVHPRPAEALSDGEQAIPLAELRGLLDSLDAVAKAVGRRLDRSLA